MARKISAHTTEAPGSTSDLIGNIGSTTKRFTAQQILSIPITAQGDLLFGDSSADTTRLAPPTSGAVLQYSSASSAPAWVTITSGGVLIGAALGTPTFLAPPTSGAVLTFSSASSIPAWSIPTSGAVLVASSLGTPTWRALGTSGQVLQSTGGSPAWVDSNTLTGAVTTAGTSGQVLQTTAGAAAWVASNTLTGTVTTAGTSGQVLQTTAGAASWVASNTLAGTITTAGTSGQLLQTSGGAATWVGMTSGSLLYGSSLGAITELPAGTSGQVLKMSTLGSGLPTWSSDEAGAGGTGTSNAWKVKRDTTMTVTTAAYITINWNFEEIDTDGFFSTAANSSIVTITTGGTYLLAARFESDQVTNNITFIIRAGTTNLVLGTMTNAFVGVSAGEVHTIVALSSGVAIDVQALARAAAVQLTTLYGMCQFWGHKLY
mgnify:CR=1 FL=1